MTRPTPSSVSWSVNERVVMLWTTVYGLDGTNGLNGTTKTLGREMKEFQTWRSELEAQGRLLKWLALVLASLIGWLMSDQFARFLARILVQ